MIHSLLMATLLLFGFAQEALCEPNHKDNVSEHTVITHTHADELDHGQQNTNPRHLHCHCVHIPIVLNLNVITMLHGNEWQQLLWKYESPLANSFSNELLRPPIS